ncbi:MAG: polyprenol monophosphomannose synthase, partial [Flavobacteriaceae bacterium]|nr:polyprenol monophosphomannose synthase [Bacteroidia bacterium]NNK88725.1 polyprenol monophosphomannose synthase [Flavobacteriaceae bacterium]
ALIRAVFGLESAFDLLVVDDNSPDGTADLVRQLQEEFPNRLFLEVRPEKSGLGTAYIHGFKWCLERHYQYIFEMDADFSHNPADLERLHRTCLDQGADVAIGSRYVKGVNVVNWPLSRVLLSYLASIYVRVITGMKIYDTTAGFVCYHRKVLETIDLDNIKFIGYAFQIEMKFKAHIRKFKIVEIPIVFTDRVRGESKLSGNIIYEAIFGVIKMKFKSLIGKE